MNIVYKKFLEEGSQASSGKEILSAFYLYKNYVELYTSDFEPLHVDLLYSALKQKAKFNSEITTYLN